MAVTINPFTGEPQLINAGGGGSDAFAFAIIQPPAGTSPTASTTSDTLSLTSTDSSLTITGNSTTKTVNFAVAGKVAKTGDTMSGQLSISGYAAGATTPLVVNPSSASGNLADFKLNGSAKVQVTSDGKVVATGALVNQWGFGIGSGNNFGNQNGAQQNMSLDDGNHFFAFSFSSGTATGITYSKAFMLVDGSGASASSPMLAVKQPASASGDLLQLQNSSGTSIAGFDAKGVALLPKFTTGNLPAATTAAKLCFFDAGGGSYALIYSDGTSWRKVKDDTVVT